MLLIVGIAVIGLLVPNYMLLRDVAYPGFIQNAIWAFTLFLLYVFEADFYAIDAQVLLAVLLTVLGFSIGSIFCLSLFYKRTFVIERKKQTIEIYPLKSHKKTLSIFIWIAILIFPLFLLRMFEIAGGGSVVTFFFRLREALVDDDGANMFGVGYYSYFCTCIFAFKLVSSKRYMTVNNAFLFALALAIAMLLAAKGFLLVLILCATGILLIQRKLSTKKIAFFSFAVFALMAGVIQALRQFGAVDDLAADSIVKVYLLSGLPALSTLLNSEKIYASSHVFRVALVWAARFGYNVEVPPIVQQFVNVPFGTNTFTYLRPYILDFGLIGVFFFSVLFGLIHSFIYAKAKRGDASFIILYGFSLFPLVMQSFDDQYFTNLSLWVYLSFFIFVFYLFSNYRSTLSKAVK